MDNKKNATGEISVFVLLSFYLLLGKLENIIDTGLITPGGVTGGCISRLLLLMDVGWNVGFDIYILMHSGEIRTDDMFLPYSFTDITAHCYRVLVTCCNLSIVPD